MSILVGKPQTINSGVKSVEMSLDDGAGCPLLGVGWVPDGGMTISQREMISAHGIVSIVAGDGAVWLRMPIADVPSDMNQEFMRRRLPTVGYPGEGGQVKIGRGWKVLVKFTDRVVLGEHCMDVRTSYWSHFYGDTSLRLIAHTSRSENVTEVKS